MPSLRDTQERFLDGVLHEAPGAAALVAPGRFPAGRHLQVYRNNVFASLTAALADLYPVVARLVGDGFFAYAAHEYIRRHPPTRGSLHEFGAELAGFLAGFAPAATLPYLPDTARLEWAWHEAFHAADAAGFDPATLAAVAPERYGDLRFALHPSARLLASGYPVLRIWQVNQEGYAGDPAVDLAEGGVRLLVIRRGLEVRIEPLAAADHALLAELARGATLADACDAALALDPRIDLAAWLARHVRAATLSGFAL